MQLLSQNLELQRVCGKEHPKEHPNEHPKEHPNEITPLSHPPRETVTNDGARDQSCCSMSLVSSTSPHPDAPSHPGRHLADYARTRPRTTDAPSHTGRDVVDQEPANCTNSKCKEGIRVCDVERGRDQACVDQEDVNDGGVGGGRGAKRGGEGDVGEEPLVGDMREVLMDGDRLAKFSRFIGSLSL